MQSIPSAPWEANLAASPPASPTDARFARNLLAHHRNTTTKPSPLITSYDARNDPPDNNAGARRKSSLGTFAWNSETIDELDDNVISPHTLLSTYRRPFSANGSNLQLPATMEDNTLQPPPTPTSWAPMSPMSNNLLSPHSAENPGDFSTNGSESVRDPFGYQSVSYTLGKEKRDGSKLVCEQRAIIGKIQQLTETQGSRAKTRPQVQTQ